MELFLNGLFRLFCLMPIIWLTKHSFENNFRNYLLIFCILFLFDTVLFGSLLFEGQNWNWFGNIARLFWTLTFIYTTKLLTKRDIGWTFYIYDRRVVFVIVSTFILLRLILRFIFQGLNGGYNLETFFYESTLPGISEEILFRGIFLGLLNKVYFTKWTFINTTFGWGLILTSILFGLIHGLLMNKNWLPNFNSQKFVMTTSMGFLFGFIKEKSKSLVPGILTHNLWNVIAYWSA